VLVLEKGRPADEAGDAAVAFCFEGILSPPPLSAVWATGDTLSGA